MNPQQIIFSQEDEISSAMGKCSPSKALIGKCGWIFLTNDTNDFFSYQFGLRKWDKGTKAIASQYMQERCDYISAHGAKYLKFIIPEKSVAYK